MSQTTEDIIAAAMTLPPGEKVKLAEQLLESVEADSSEIDKLWVVEAQRRLQELEEGKVETIPAEDVFRSLDARIPAALKAPANP